MIGLWLALLASSALADTATLGLVSQTLDCRVAGGDRLCTFSSPGAGPRREHFRLQSACDGPLRVNGIAVAHDQTGWPVTGLLRTDRPNEVSMPAGCPAPALLITPRVFAIALDPGETVGKTGVLLVNTLENTTNVSLEVNLRRRPAYTWSGTLHPDEQRFIELDLHHGWETILLWKAPEAIEDAYYFRLAKRRPVL